MRKELLVTFIFLLISSLSYGQIIDSISIKPYIGVDSLVFWHTLEIKQDKQIYVEFGCYQYCVCNSEKTLNKKQNTRHTLPIYGGTLIDNKKHGDWIYWMDAKRYCCNEIQLSPDSTVSFKYGKRIKKIDHKAIYYYNTDSMIVKPFYDNNELNYQIECVKGCCKLTVNEGLIIKEFKYDYLYDELELVLTGTYDYDSKSKITQATKR